jgi:exodeoxyribonuclease VII small subunit
MASFEDQLAELEKVVDRLERGDLSLEENVGLFERGVHLSNACKAQLSVEDLAVAVADEEGEEEEEEFDADDDEVDDELDDGRL